MQCLCGASIGHRQEREGSTMYRFKKYTVRPIMATQRYTVHQTCNFISSVTLTPSSFPRIPFTAFVAADMADLAQAHASYRFVIQDEENEVPRVLVSFFLDSADSTANLTSPRSRFRFGFSSHRSSCRMLEPQGHGFPRAGRSPRLK